MSAESRFWRLLGDYEALTQQEAAALAQSDYPRMAQVAQLKLTILPDCLEFGAQLGLNRLSSPELGRRLDALAAQAEAHRERLAVLGESTRRRLAELGRAQQRLGQIRRNYRAEVGSAPGAFAALG